MTTERRREDPAAGPAAPSSASDVAALIAEQLPRRRRRLGLAFVGLGVLALAAQTFFEWLLPYDGAGLLNLRRWLAMPALSPAMLAWGWAALCVLLLATLVQRHRAHDLLAALAGLALGSAYAAAGGPSPAVAMLCLVGVASLGWQARGGGGLALLLGTAVAVAAWDALLSGFPTLWIAAAVLVAMFVWIDSRHIRASDRRLFAALEERDALIRDLDARGEELRTVERARTRLLASISHDLRQPLQAVRLYAEALRARPDLDTTARRLLKQQVQAADDAVGMLDQFSEFSAIEHGMLVSHPELVNLREVLEHVAGGLQPAYPKSRLRLSVHGRPTWVWIDRSQVTRLVQNLAGNAVRYSVGVPIEGPARVVLAVRPQGGGCVIDVVDNGRGIPADKLEAVFEPYVQLAQAVEASRAGRGLGLAIVRGLVAQLGLALAPVKSRLGNGTRFRVGVPAALMREAPQPRTVTGIRLTARLDGWLLALLDDEDAPRLALRAALESVGATVVEAESLGRLKRVLDAQERFPDVLVFDLDLGSHQPDGRAALAELRQEWEMQVPAVILTGRVGARSIILPPQCSMLEKPVALAELVGVLNRIAPRTDLPL
ncbi:MAG: hybrid sensor histidine kinase/response regulator [Betaproteobacteria bacterium]|nr:hybrid sensor histidine kinase/response regulator [Betaproteobacteria bacterium]MCC6247177.1 hybrid sensor histidine kinase/response regulator [Rubrivivax sp.]MCL4697994.1 hybrid sensor histidine kinase/response regulator [Burkholderiaceae bacterium]